ncbi:transporter substrate-binding domain-containing protein [Polaromonas eurypsychrophila]|uniref:ABC transporter substrate-binding protein n=1 Tax=Polaromonas eurypsychrophila TaxID=1614635 RepID=A0A916SLL5_9BURK|nr:transporter substrate-binding domain-containing protein [Polaromonas eurypsychrophila]GGB06077.1 ABC transporter substrate-binding protein [Polaromonas eurypsychrophila]
MTLPNFSRRLGLSLLLSTAALLAACAGLTPPADPAARQALAPTGVLRVGVYAGSPTSLVRDPKTGKSAGVALELGQALGQQLGVPVQVVEFSRLALVLDGIKAGTVDFTFTNATEVRARDMDFTEPLIRLELGYLVPPPSTLVVNEMDRSGVRVGVAQGSSSQGALGRLYKNATVVPAASLEMAQQMLRQGQLDAFATNKGILFEMSDQLPGYRVLDGRWGLESLAIAIPKGREAGMPYLRQFARDAQSSGRLSAIVAVAGLRGLARVD